MPPHSQTYSRTHSRVSAFALVLISIGTLLSACTTCRVAKSPAASPQASGINRQSAAPAAPSASNALVCPTRGSSLVQEPLPANSGHRVILSWKASAAPNAKHSAAFGYCIYRGKNEHDPYPQLVNAIPFQGTRCMDDWVESSGKYTYVVRAISVRRMESDPSNVISVVIPSGKSGNSVSAISAPLCRLPAAVSK
jgi:hypothetical protein